MMLALEEIQVKFLRGERENSLHAAEQMVERTITLTEILEAMQTAESVEVYPTDKYGASMLILGFTSQQRPLHLHVSASARERIKLITVYEPNAEKWINFRTRIRKE
jgi:hypothetical protein